MMRSNLIITFGLLLFFSVIADKLDAGNISNTSSTSTGSVPDSNGKNYFTNNGYFDGKDGSIPANWYLYHTKNRSAVGLTGQFGFEQSTKVLRMTGPSAEDINIQTSPMPLPEKGELEFSVWARATGGSATISIYLLGQKNYHWIIKKSFQLSGGWTKCTIKGIVPEKGPTEHQRFWCRMMVTKGQDAIIGRMELKRLEPTDQSGNDFTRYPTNPALSRNLVCNPDFELGGWGWEQYFCSASISNLTGNKLSEYYQGQLPQLVSDGVDGGTALRIDPDTDLMTFCFPIAAGKEYTVSAFLKCATPGKTTECSILLIANNMKYYSKKFTVTDQWQRYSFSNIWQHFSRRKNAYVRINARGNEPLIIDQVQAEQGKLSSFSTFPIQLGLVTAPDRKFNIFNVDEREAQMILKAICRPDVKGPVEIKAVVTDAWGKTVSTHQFKAEAASLLTFPIKINKSGQRGVFHVTLQAFDSKGSLIGNGISRYAICRNLAETSLPDNPVAGHFEIWRNRYAEGDFLNPILKNYLPVNQFNRCFFQYTPKHLQSPSLNADIAKMAAHWDFPSSVIQTWCLFSGVRIFKQYFNDEILLNKTLSSENLNQFRNTLTAIVAPLKDQITCLELINEPYGWRIETGAKKGEKCMEPEKTAQLYQIAHEVIKSIDPKIKLVGPCIALGYDEWTERFLNAGGGKWLDIFTIHGYCGNSDVFDTFGKLMAYRTLLNRYGIGHMKIWNTEQYFGPRIPYKELYEDEYIRDYFSDCEIDHAAESLSNLINSAAAGVPVATFAFPDTIAEGLGKELFVYDYFAVLNCAAEFLGDAGTGTPVEMGSALRCFLFPEAKNGPLATIHTINQAERGTILLPPEVKAYNMMGNLLKGGKSVLDHSIVYLQFPTGMSKAAVLAKLSGLELLGFGKAFSLSGAMTNKDTLTVSLNNRLNQPASGSVTIEKCPDQWTVTNSRLLFSDLAPGKTTKLNFRLGKSETQLLNIYHFKFLVKTEKESFIEDMAVSSLYTNYNTNVAGNGNLDAWSDIKPITLGKEHLSKKFSSTLNWAGPDDLSADLKVAWNEKGVGISLIVTDDHFSFTQSPASSFQNDSIQLYFDMRNGVGMKDKSMDVTYQISYNGKNAIAYLDKCPTGRFIGEANRQEGIDADVKVTCRQLTANKLFYDIFLPSKVLPAVKFKAGTAMGFSLLINDNDGKGRKTGLTLAPKGKEPFNNPHEYVDLILQHK